MKYYQTKSLDIMADFLFQVNPKGQPVYHLTGSITDVIDGEQYILFRKADCIERDGKHDRQGYTQLGNVHIDGVFRPFDETHMGRSVVWARKNGVRRHNDGMEMKELLGATVPRTERISVPLDQMEMLTKVDDFFESKVLQNRMYGYMTISEYVIPEHELKVIAGAFLGIGGLLGVFAPGKTLLDLLMVGAGMFGTGYLAIDGCPELKQRMGFYAAAWGSAGYTITQLLLS